MRNQGRRMLPLGLSCRYAPSLNVQLVPMQQVCAYSLLKVYESTSGHAAAIVALLERRFSHPYLQSVGTEVAVRVIAVGIAAPQRIVVDQRRGADGGAAAQAGGGRQDPQERIGHRTAEERRVGDRLFVAAGCRRDRWGILRCV